MNHSMIAIEERGLVLALCGQDESGNLLDTCEAYFEQDKNWRIFNTLNFKGKNLGLCKFVESKDSEKRYLVYAFGKQGIERLDLNKKPVDQKWELLLIKNFSPINMFCTSVQYDEQLIMICGGSPEDKGKSRDVVFLNQQQNVLGKDPNIQLSMLDKFSGSQMTQYVIDRSEMKIYFASDDIVHELEYTNKGGVPEFKFKQILQVSV